MKIGATVWCRNIYLAGNPVSHSSGATGYRRRPSQRRRATLRSPRPNHTSPFARVARMAYNHGILRRLYNNRSVAPDLRSICARCERPKAHVITLLPHHRRHYRDGRGGRTAPMSPHWRRAPPRWRRPPVTHPPMHLSSGPHPTMQKLAHLPLCGTGGAAVRQQTGEKS